MYFCEQTFLTKHTREHTCETAIYHEQNPDLIKDKCNIQYYPELDPTSQILDAGKHILLGNIPEPWPVVSCTEDFQGIRFLFIIVKYRNYHRCSRNQYRLMLHLMFHLLERSVKLCKDVR